jgi:serine/threonine protein kinase
MCAVAGDTVVMPGARLGAYRIQERIGIGGKVYRAHDTKLGRDVAIKILPRDFIGDPDRLARFEREATHAGRAQSPQYWRRRTRGESFIAT